MEISDSDIERAAGILIPQKQFTQSHVDVIKCFESRDVVACPGSGKTTALLAKLVILAKRMPFPDGRGICVLTHTNVAIDEIKKRLGKGSDVLFRHPNFFGTIHSFVDKFLALPCYRTLYGKHPNIIDNSAYEEAIDRFSKRFPAGFDSQLKCSIQHFLFGNPDLLSSMRFRNSNPIELLQKFDGKPLNIKRPKTRGQRKYSDFSVDTKRGIYEWIASLKNVVMGYAGVLCFDDTYYLAEKYLALHPSLKDVISKRFSHVFIDEMQDTAKHQQDLIDGIFDHTHVVIQRFGDPHQEIFDFTVVGESAWRPRNPLPLTQSQRFGENIAKHLRTVCDCHYPDLSGQCQDSIQSCIITFDDKSITRVLQKYAELICEHGLNTQGSKPFKAVAWIGKDKTEEKGKLCIRSYWPAYMLSLQSRKSHFPNLFSYIRKLPGRSVKNYSDSIINAVVRAVTLGGLKKNKNRGKTYFSAASFIFDIREYHPKLYTSLIANLASWSKSLYNSQEDYNLSVYGEVKEFIINDIKRCYEGFDTGKCAGFLNDIEPEIPIESCKCNNRFIPEGVDGVDINVGTVHSVKGETHKATLYMETFYQRQHESERIIEHIKGMPYIPPRNKPDIRMKQALKIAHVAMSRPTHLLCFAAHKDRIEPHRPALERAGWRIVAASAP